MSKDGEKLFEDSRECIEEAIRFVARRRRMGQDDYDEFRSFALLKLIENDYARLRKFEGDASLRTYLSVVVHRLHLDYQTAKWGKWRPSAKAKRLGEPALTLERLVYRDGLEMSEAIETMAASSDVSREALWNVGQELPVRHKRRFVDEEHVAALSAAATDAVERLEERVLAKRVEFVLAQALGSLGRDDRRLLELRYREGHAVPEIAAELGIEAKPLYSRMRRVLAKLRERLTDEIEDGTRSVECLPTLSKEIDLEHVFAGARG